MSLLAGGNVWHCRLETAAPLHHFPVCLIVCVPGETQEPGLWSAQLQQTRGREGWDWGRTLAGLLSQSVPQYYAHHVLSPSRYHA